MLDQSGKKITDEELAARKSMSFAQAEGAEPIPTPLEPKFLSSEVRAYLWAILWDSMKIHMRRADFARHAHFLDPWKSILAIKHVLRDHGAADEFDNNADDLAEQIKEIIMQGNYIRALDFIQWLLRQPACPPNIPDGIAWALKAGRAAYMIIDRNTVVPTASDEEATTLILALDATQHASLPGPRRHLMNAAQKLTEGDWPACVRESINAVEATARIIEPNSRNLGPALTALERKGKIHPAMRVGFASLYGFTSDEGGIRHSLLEKPEAQVDEADAQYMLGACAAFVSYLLQRTRSP